MLKGLSGTTTLFFRNAPQDCTPEALTKVMEKYGPIASVKLTKGQGCGAVEFHLPASAEKACSEAISIQGKTINVKRAMPPLPGDLTLGLAQQALVEPARSAEALDVVVVHGSCTAVGIGITAMFAKAKTTTLVLWNSHHYVGQEQTASSSLQKKVYAEAMEEEKMDRIVMGKAFDFFGQGMPKCALLHIESDQLKQTSTQENPLLNVDGLIKDMAENHLETLGGFYAAGIYQPWIHAYRAVCFMLHPPSIQGDWPTDPCICNVSTRRQTMVDPLRLPDGSGWTVGLQMTNESVPIMSGLAFEAMNTIVLGDDKGRHLVSGKNVELTMPQPSLWYKTQSS